MSDICYKCKREIPEGDLKFRGFIWNGFPMERCKECEALRWQAMKEDKEAIDSKLAIEV